jgi:ribosomal protein L29
MRHLQPNVIRSADPDHRGNSNETCLRTPKELPKELDEIQGKLGQLCVVKATDGRVAKFGKIKLVRKRFARDLIVDCQKQKVGMCSQYKGKRCLPLGKRYLP